jgi:hypothetical protein
MVAIGPKELVQARNRLPNPYNTSHRARMIYDTPTNSP